jgi:hypothetical protein
MIFILSPCPVLFSYPSCPVLFSYPSSHFHRLRSPSLISSLTSSLFDFPRADRAGAARAGAARAGTMRLEKAPAGARRQRVRNFVDFSLCQWQFCWCLSTRPETICRGTSKLACWRVQLSTASKVGRRGAGTATASIEASLLAGYITHPPAQIVPFILANELCRPPAQKV